MVQRIQKVLASSGVASRRACEALITAGRVTVNGIRITELGAKADPDTDDIRVDGKPIQRAPRQWYIVLNKPTGVVTTMRDPHAQRTVMNLISGVPERVYPVGRLDAETAGVLILTNDGDFAQALAHPSHAVPKTYRAVVRGLVDEFALTDLRLGVMLEDGMASASEAVVVERRDRENVSVLDITLHEGRKRQVRRMLDAVGHRVLALTRTQVGPVTLQGLAPGTWRKLRAREIAELLAVSRSADSSSGPSRPGEGDSDHP